MSSHFERPVYYFTDNPRRPRKNNLFPDKVKPVVTEAHRNLVRCREEALAALHAGIYAVATRSQTTGPLSYKHAEARAETLIKSLDGKTVEELTQKLLELATHHLSRTLRVIQFHSEQQTQLCPGGLLQELKEYAIIVQACEQFLGTKKS